MLDKTQFEKSLRSENNAQRFWPQNSSEGEYSVSASPLLDQSITGLRKYSAH